MYDNNRRGRVSGRVKTAAIAFTTTVALAAGIGAVTMTPGAEAAGQATSTTGLSVRSGPSTKNRVIGALKTGQKVTTAGPSKSGWTPINYNGQTAYVATRYVRITESAAKGDAPSSGTGTVTANALSVRSGAGVLNREVGTLRRGQRVDLAGKTKSGWTPITYKKKTAYVSAKYLKVTTSGTPDVSEPDISPVVDTTSSTKTTAALQVRTGPALTYRSVTVLSKGAKVDLTGKTSGGYSQIAYKGSNRWVSTRYLKSSSTTSTDPTPPKKTFRGIATADLLIRSSSSSKYKVIRTVPKGSKLELTGVVKNNRAQVVDKKVLRWVNNTYVRPLGPAVPSGNLPKVAEYRYATVALDIRSASKNSYTLTEVPAGTKLGLTGVYADGRAQVIYRGALRWVTSRYLTSTKGPNISSSSRGISGLRPSTKYLMSRVQAEFPSIVTFYGVRPDSIPDHPSGKALDIMLPSYRSNRAMGQAIADWARANSRELNVEYIIFNQRIWNVKRSREGWRYMASRGSDTANHKDHVHITVLN